MPDTDGINILIKEGEGLTVEFKEKYTPKIDRVIVAFANQKADYCFSELMMEERLSARS